MTPVLMFEFLYSRNIVDDVGTPGDLGGQQTGCGVTCEALEIGALVLGALITRCCL